MREWKYRHPILRERTFAAYVGLFLRCATAGRQKLTLGTDTSSANRVCRPSDGRDRTCTNGSQNRSNVKLRHVALLCPALGGGAFWNSAIRPFVCPSILSVPGHSCLTSSISSYLGPDNMEKRCSQHGLPEREDNVTVASAINQVKSTRQHIQATIKHYT